jgi:hypothetical protein
MNGRSLSQEAVEHARLAERAAELSWKHIWAEYTQDPEQIAATLATDAPIAWTLARESAADDGAYRFLAGTTIDEVRGQYETLRQDLEIRGWEPLLELRSGWYTMWQGVSQIHVVANGATHEGQTVVLFPVGSDGILGELQIATVGRLPMARRRSTRPACPNASSRCSTSTRPTSTPCARRTSIGSSRLTAMTRPSRSAAI